MTEIKIDEDFIKLGQLLKLAGVCSSGAEAKFIVKNGNVTLNGNVVLERGKKIARGDLVATDKINIKVI